MYFGKKKKKKRKKKKVYKLIGNEPYIITCNKENKNNKRTFNSPDIYLYIK
jgi:hypothetical protein